MALGLTEVLSESIKVLVALVAEVLVAAVLAVAEGLVVAEVLFEVVLFEAEFEDARNRFDSTIAMVLSR